VYDEADRGSESLCICEPGGDCSSDAGAVAGRATGFLLFLGVVFTVINCYLFRKEREELVRDLVGRAGEGRGTAFDRTGTSGLPDPVLRYLRKAIPEGRVPVMRVRLEQW